MIQARIKGKADLSGLQRAVDQMIRDVSKRALQIAKEETPIRSGRARKSWKTDDRGLIISNNVPYIEQLEKGRSKQAPSGILRPTARRVKGYFNTRRLAR